MSNAAPLPCPVSTGSRALDEIAEVIGVGAALDLASAFRGLDLYVRKAYRDEDEIVAAIGRAAADQLAAYFGGTTVTIPMRIGVEHAVRSLDARGDLTRHEIARTLRIAERQVYRILSRPAADDRQYGLFTDG